MFSLLFLYRDSLNTKWKSSSCCYLRCTMTAIRPSSLMITSNDFACIRLVRLSVGSLTSKFLLVKFLTASTMQSNTSSRWTRPANKYVLAVRSVNLRAIFEKISWCKSCILKSFSRASCMILTMSVDDKLPVFVFLRWMQSQR